MSHTNFAKMVNDHHPNKNGTWCAPFDYTIVLYWDQNKYKRTVPLTPNSKNVGMLHMAPGIRKYCMMTNIKKNDKKEQDMLKKFTDIWQTETQYVTHVSSHTKEEGNIRTTKSISDKTRRVAKYKNMVNNLTSED